MEGNRKFILWYGPSPETAKETLFLKVRTIYLQALGGSYWKKRGTKHRPAFAQVKREEKKIPAKIVTCPHWEFAKKHNSHLNLTKRKRQISSLFHFLWARLELSDLACFSPAWSHVDTGQFSWLFWRTKIYGKLQEWSVSCWAQELWLWDTPIPLGFHCKP